METREEAVVVATGATGISEVPEPGITFPVKDKRLVVSASGRRKMKQQEYMCLQKVAEQMQFSDPSCLQSAGGLCVLGRAATAHRSLCLATSRPSLWAWVGVGLACPSPLELLQGQQVVTDSTGGGGTCQLQRVPETLPVPVMDTQPSC